MNNALIGYSGFVGTTLRNQTTFESLYRSTNISEIENQTFDMVVCAGAPAQKWKANQNPEEDAQNIDALIAHLDTISCETFVLISTVDVFKSPIGVNESSIIDEDDLHPYGFNRYRLEKFVQEKFSRSLIVRLPGLVGPGLRKNIIFDFLNNNQVEKIESEAVFQFYPMVNLWYDIQTALQNKLGLVHLTAAPVSVADVALRGFGFKFKNSLSPSPARYDMQSEHAGLFDNKENYTYSEAETIQAIRAYAQSEPKTDLN